MKKRSRWILILSALLCLCMLFASCQSGKEPQDENGDLETSLPEEAIPENEKVEYDKIVAEWTKYLKYEPSQTGGSVSAEKVFSVNYNTDTVDELEYGFIVRSNIANGEWVYDVFNIYSGKKVVESLYGSYSFDATGCIIEVRQYNGGTYTYDYYDSNGEKINADPLSEPAQMHADYDSNTFAVLDRGYQVRDGRIVAIYEAGKEIAFPETVEYKENKYYFDYYGENVVVYDKNNKKIAGATFEGADSYDCYILSNGNVLIEESYNLPDKAVEYTYKDDDNKFDLVYRLIDIKSAEITEIPATFVIDTMITPAQNAPWLKLAVAGEENQFAMIRKIVDGRLEAVADYVILSDALEITTELPKIVKNQTDIYGALDANTLIIRAATGDDGEWLYSVDLSKGSVELYADLDEYMVIDGGYICEEIEYGYYYVSHKYTVYDNDMNKLMELPENCEVNIEYGLVFVRDFNDEDRSWKLLVIDGGQASLKTMSTEYLWFRDYYTVNDGNIFVINGVWYNENGDFLLNENDYDYCDVVGIYSDAIVIEAYFGGVETYYTVG